MKITTIRKLIANFICASAVCTVSGSALAAEPPSHNWPTQTVRLVVTFPPGGSADALARILSTRLSKELGQPVIVENRVGAGGSIGTAYVAKAAPDGHTFLVSAGGSLVVRPLISPQNYDTLKDLVPVSQLVTSPFALAVSTAAFGNSVTDAKGFISRISKSKEATAYGTGGNGTQMHLAGELFGMLTDAPLTHVPYKGAGPAVVDLLGGSVPMVVVDLASVAPSMKSDRIRVLAVSSKNRSLIAPSVPSAAEAGIPDWQASGWIGLLAPAKTPATIVARMEKEVNALLREQPIIDQVLLTGNEPMPSTSDDFKKFIDSEFKRWKAVVTKAGVKAD